MGETAVVLEIDGASPKAGGDVDIRQVRRRDQSESGKPGFAAKAAWLKASAVRVWVRLSTAGSGI